MQEQPKTTDAGANYFKSYRVFAGLPLAGNSESGLSSRWLPSNSPTGQLVTRIDPGQLRGHAGPAAHPLGLRHIQVHRAHRTFSGPAPHWQGPLRIRLASSTSTGPAAHLLRPGRNRTRARSVCIHHIFFSIFHRIFLEKSFFPLFTRIFSRKKILEKILVNFSYRFLTRSLEFSKLFLCTFLSTVPKISDFCRLKA